MSKPIMYIFINTSLKMSAGKVAGQVGHLVQQIIEDVITLGNNSNKKYKKYKKYIEWKNEGCTKIILKATLEQINELKKRGDIYYVLDAGKTQIEPGSLTVVGFCPMVTSEFTEYKLY
jgi:PTH2 family peptidyl-tRNA hydrolase